MSLLQFTDAISSRPLQIWNNAAYDDASGGGGGGEGFVEKASWCPLRPISTNRSEELDFNSGKENRSPGCQRSPVAKKPSVSSKSFQDFSVKVAKFDDDDVDDRSIDAEVEEIEREIGRLSARLEILRIKKADRELRLAASCRRGRIVPAKFLDPKQSSAKNPGTPALKKVEESPASVKSRRRGLSLGPGEITAGIALTPIPSVQSRRKSCYLKLEDIKEEEEVSKGKVSIARPSEPRKGLLTKKVAESPARTTDSRIRQRGISVGPAEIASATRNLRPIKFQETKETVVKKEKGRSSSASPKSRRPSVAKVSELRKGIATVGAKKPVKREDGSLASIKPKTLFQEGKNQVSSKKQPRNAKFRIVASRYSVANSHVYGSESGSKRRKWSLPDTGKEETAEAANKRSLSLGESEVAKLVNSKNAGSETTMKCENSPPSILRVVESLPRIRTIRCLAESPRDSGCAKRVADLIGRKSHFALTDGEVATSPCQRLAFEEEEE